MESEAYVPENVDCTKRVTYYWEIISVKKMSPSNTSMLQCLTAQTKNLVQMAESNPENKDILILNKISSKITIQRDQTNWMTSAFMTLLTTTTTMAMTMMAIGSTLNLKSQTS